MAFNDAICTLLVFPRLEFLWLKGPGELGVVFGSIFLAVVLTGSVIFHAVCFVFERASVVTISNFALRAFVYCFPAILLGWQLVTSYATQEPNRINPATSPSGRYVLHVSTHGETWWIDIRDSQHEENLTADTENSGYHGGYWIWDNKDRLWFISSDTGRTSFWQNADSGWLRGEFDWRTAPGDAPIPPRNLFKKNWQDAYDQSLREWNVRHQQTGKSS